MLAHEQIETPDINGSGEMAAGGGILNAGHENTVLAATTGAPSTMDTVPSGHLGVPAQATLQGRYTSIGHIKSQESMHKPQF